MPDHSNRYDYIIAGLGCAGMSLLLHMLASGRFAGKRILAVDREPKDRNDRTWCFWEKEAGLFEPVVSHQWERLACYGEKGELTEMDIRPSRYRMIRGIDFYRYCRQKIGSAPNIELLYGEIGEVAAGYVVLNGRRIRAGWVFSSIPSTPAPRPGQFRLLQHFTGWEIETTKPVFTPGTATLMDFRVAQSPGTAFVYVMPFSTRHALVEFTVFSAALLKDEDYRQALEAYCGRLVPAGGYRVLAKEFGIIPMTNEMPPSGEKGLTWLGTAGGQTKPSTGYTFSFIQRQSARLVRDIVTRGEPSRERRSWRFRFYDSVLLNVLATGKAGGSTVFMQLFRRNRPADILAFLANQSNAWQDLRILTSLPLSPFARAGWEEFRKSWRRT